MANHKPFKWEKWILNANDNESMTSVKPKILVARGRGGMPIILFIPRTKFISSDN